MSVNESCEDCGRDLSSMDYHSREECVENLLSDIHVLRCTLRDIRRFTFAYCSEEDGNMLRGWIDLALKCT